jgi:uncharacterized membrane protein YgcG
MMAIDTPSMAGEAAAQGVRAARVVRHGSLWEVIGARVRWSAVLLAAVLVTACGESGGVDGGAGSGGGSGGGGSSGGGNVTQS